MNKQQQQALAARRAHQKKVRAMVFGLITVIVVGVSVSLLVSAFSPKTPPPPPTRLTFPPTWAAST